MITFKEISFKNFLSVGNHPNRISLNIAATTLVVGRNGYGKSTMLDALTFVLFGKPFRNITKPQLINSINRKNCVVTIDFDVDGKSYKIIRGMKPTIFEIWYSLDSSTPDKLLNQTAASKDYQRLLESQILKMTYKAFTQVVILGSASFVPFMQLPAQARREVIEDILDIRVFSLMNVLLKAKAQSLKDLIIKMESSLVSARDRVISQRKLIASITTTRESSIEKIQVKIKESLASIDTATATCNRLSADISDYALKRYNLKSVRECYEELRDKSFRLESRISTAKNYLDFVQREDTCPSCNQGISHEHKAMAENTNGVLIDELKAQRRDVQVQMSALSVELEELTKIDAAITESNIQLSTSMGLIDILNKQILDYRQEIEEYNGSHSDLDVEQARLKEIIHNGMMLASSRDDMINQRGIQDVAAILLKDTGIKTAIIREYLPTMNRLINHYLHVMDSYIQLELDENFNEVIKSRHRDEFTYSSFSEGEKSRINLSILFTWRHIARAKNSINTNLLIFDEIFDSSLDGAGTDSFIQLLGEESRKTNVFVITHKEDAFVDKFEKVLRINKKGDFSTISLE